MKSDNRILIAVDESEASRRTVGYVAGLVNGSSHVHVSLVHLELPPRMLEWAGSEDAAIEDQVEKQRSEEYRRMEIQRKEKGQALLAELQALFTRSGAKIEGRYVRFEEPLDATTVTRAILDAARRHECGTVVVGRHAFAGMRRWFQHNVAHNLVQGGKGVSVWVVE